MRRIAENGEPIYARARLESAEVEEKFYFGQQISANPSIWERGDPAGSIKLVLPFDGDKCFGRRAHRDVTYARRAGADPDADALVGFLTFTDYGGTDLNRLPGLADRHGSLPITVRLPLKSAPGEADPLLADELACVVAHDYRPRASAGKLAPVRVSLRIDEPDTTEIGGVPGAIADYHYTRIVRQAGFKAELALSMQVSLALPRDMAAGAQVTVEKVFIRWPTRTSLSSLDLQVEGQEPVLRYNPERAGKGGLEWCDVAMQPEDEPAGGDTREFHSPVMILSVPRPGDLYRADTLEGEVTVTVDRLLSGTEARLFDAAGKRCRQPKLTLRSSVSTEFSLTLDDAFRRRVRSPYQQMHFGEVVPTEARIDDIGTALKNQGFAVLTFPEVATEAERPAADTRTWWLSARRPHGAQTLSLLLCVEGRRYRTRRQRQIHEGATYQTTVDSGDLDIYACGFLAGDSKTVVREMNALRRALRARFERLPDRR